MLQRFISLCHRLQWCCSVRFSTVIAQTQTLHLGGQRRKERRFPQPEQRNFKYTLKAVLHTIPSIDLSYQLPDLPDMCVQRLQIDIEKIGNRHTERLLFVPQALIRRFSIGAGCAQLYILRSIVCIGCHPDFPLPDNEDFSDDFFRRINDPGFLPTYSMPELYGSIFHSKPPIIQNLLYPGTYLFAGAPKIGKSFLMAQLAFHVSSGKPLWNFAVQQGTVLYLALEDNQERLQQRLYRMFGTDVAPALYFSNAAKPLGGGLDQQIETFRREHPDTNLVIIDTLQKVRESGNEKCSYASDYEIISKLKSLAEKLRICLLLVHHTRKQQAEDRFDMISGTNGLLGCADGR